MKVWPRNDDLRKLLRHPVAGGFRESGSANWPDDTFTYRLLQDGDLTKQPPTGERRKPDTAKPAVKGE
jgi:hypothetical protein